MLDETPEERSLWDEGEIRTFVGDREESRESFRVEKGPGSFVVLTSDGWGDPDWRSELRYDASWWIQSARIEVLDSKRDDGFECVSELEQEGGAFALVVHADGESRRVAGPEPKERVQLWLGQEPITSQIPVCQLAGAAPLSVGYFPGFTAELSAAAPRTFASMPTTTFTSVMVDELIEVVCLDGKFIMFHYPKHAFRAVRKGYEAIGEEISADDPQDEPFHGRIACP